MTISPTDEAREAARRIVSGWQRSLSQSGYWEEGDPLTVARALLSTPPPPQSGWRAWVKIGASPHGPFVEDVTMYDCSQKKGYRRANIILAADE